MTEWCLSVTAPVPGCRALLPRGATGGGGSSDGEGAQTESSLRGSGAPHEGGEEQAEERVKWVHEDGRGWAIHAISGSV